MNISYQGIGEWCATFCCDDPAEGSVVAVTDNGEVDACDAGDIFCGVVRSVAHDGKACSVQLAGLAEVSYSGDDEPEIGYNELVADGDGGVAVAGEDDAGMNYLVISVDTTAKTAVIKL